MAVNIILQLKIGAYGLADDGLLPIAAQRLAAPFGARTYAGAHGRPPAV
jgi:hypothetical protein